MNIFNNFETLINYILSSEQEKGKTPSGIGSGSDGCGGGVIGHDDNGSMFKRITSKLWWNMKRAL